MIPRVDPLITYLSLSRPWPRTVTSPHPSLRPLLIGPLRLLRPLIARRRVRSVVHFAPSIEEWLWPSFSLTTDSCPPRKPDSRPSKSFKGAIPTAFTISRIKHRISRFTSPRYRFSLPINILLTRSSNGGAKFALSRPLTMCVQPVRNLPKRSLVSLISGLSCVGSDRADCLRNYHRGRQNRFRKTVGSRTEIADFRRIECRTEIADNRRKECLMEKADSHMVDEVDVPSVVRLNGLIADEIDGPISGISGISASKWDHIPRDMGYFRPCIHLSVGP